MLSLEGQNKLNLSLLIFPEIQVGGGGGVLNCLGNPDRRGALVLDFFWNNPM